MKFGYVAQHILGLWKLYPLGPGIQSFEAIDMKFGLFVKHTCSLKNYYWYFCCSINSNGFVCNKESSTVKLLKFQIIYWNISDKVNHLFWVRLHFNLWALMFGVVWRPPLRRPFFTCDFTSNFWPEFRCQVP